MSLPYHIGNGWFGGFLQVTSFAIVAATGAIYNGLWYPVIVASATEVIGLLLTLLFATQHLSQGNCVRPQTNPGVTAAVPGGLQI